MSRRVNVLVGLTAITFVLASLAGLNTNYSGSLKSSRLPSIWGGAASTPIVDETLEESAPLNVAIVEAAGWHDEVIAALIHAFGADPNVKLDLHRRLERYGIQDVLRRFRLPQPVPAVKPFTAFDESNIPTILVSTTCELDGLDPDSNWNWLLEKEQTYLFCVFHHADQWDVSSPNLQLLLPWVKKELVTFVALSQHTKATLDRAAASWRTAAPDVPDVHSRYLVPVFPVDFSGTQYATGNVSAASDDRLDFALQGNYEASRRDYDKIFRHLTNFLSRADTQGGTVDLADHQSHPNIQLRLLGHGPRPAVPDFLVPHVKFDENLDYLDFYGILAQSFALLPAFSGTDYLDRKASSSVPAGLIAGTPLVATSGILNAYRYLPSGAVWFQSDDEEDFDVIGRILEMKPQERAAKKAATRAARDERIEINKVLAREWMRQGVDRIAELKKSRQSPVEAEQLQTQEEVQDIAPK